jgi:hypothetical protein
MNRLRFLLLAAVCLIVPASAVRSAPVPAGRSGGLEQVPATAPVVIHVRGLQGIHDRLVALMNKALPDVLNKYRTQIDDFFEKGPEDLLKGRKLSGLAKDGPIFFALLELPKPGDSGEPKMALILTVTDYQKFYDNVLKEEERKNAKDEGKDIKLVTIENAGRPTYFVDRKNYAIVTADKEVAESFTKKIKGLHTKISKELAAKLLAADLGVYVNMEDVTKEYADQIKQAKQTIEQVIAFGTAAADESQKKIAEMAKKAIDPVFQTIEDMQALLLTFELRSGGLALHLQSEIKGSSPTANLLQDSRPIDFEELGRLPRDRAYYLGMKASAALYANLGKIIANLPSGGGGKDSAELMKKLAKAGPNVLLSSGSFPSAGLDVSHFDDPAKVVEATLKMYHDMDFAENNLKEKPVVKKDAEKLGAFKFHSVQLTMDFDKMAEDLKVSEDAKKEFIKAIKGIYGEKKTMWIGTDGKKFVQITAPDWKTASKLLEQYTKGDGSVREVKAFGDARKEMPKQTSFLVLFDGVRLFGRFWETIKPMVPAGQLPPGWPNFPGKIPSSYIGLAVTLQPQRGGLDLFITAAAAREFYNAVILPLVGE